MILWCLQASAGHNRYCNWTISELLLLYIMNNMNPSKKPDCWIISINLITEFSDEDINLTTASVYFLFPND